MLSSKEHIISTLGKPESQSAITSIENFIEWRDNTNLEDFIQIEYRGSLKSKDIALGIEESLKVKFAKSTLTQNNWVKYLRVELEDHLRQHEILPRLTEETVKEQNKGSKDNPRVHDSHARKSATETRRLAQLEERVLHLEVENRILRKKLADQASKENVYAELAGMGADFE